MRMRDEDDPCEGCDLACSGCAFNNVDNADERKELNKTVINKHGFGGPKYGETESN